MGKPKTAVSRRKLRFNSLDDILNDAKALLAGGAVAGGGWSPGQNVGHITTFIHGSIDGLPFTLPLSARIFGRIGRGILLARGFPTGIKIPANVPDAIRYPEDMTLEVAIERLADAIHKANQQRMNGVSPLMGRLSHEQWVKFHCRHAELHFGFMYPSKQTHEQSHNQPNANNIRHTSASA
jgi:Protein of unknown function (DUF1569)